MPLRRDGRTQALAQVPVYAIAGPDNRIDGSDDAASASASILPAGGSFLLARRVAEVLRLPETATQAALFPVAYTIGTDFRPAA